MNTMRYMAVASVAAVAAAAQADYKSYSEFREAYLSENDEPHFNMLMDVEKWVTVRFTYAFGIEADVYFDGKTVHVQCGDDTTDSPSAIWQW